MRKSSNLKVNNLDQAVNVFWRLQRQWHRPSSIKAGEGFTVEQANRALRSIMCLPRLPQAFKQQVQAFQNDIISYARPKKLPSNGKKIVSIR